MPLRLLPDACGEPERLLQLAHARCMGPCQCCHASCCPGQHHQRLQHYKVRHCWLQRRCNTAAIKKLCLPVYSVRTMSSCRLTDSLRCTHLYSPMKQCVESFIVQESLPRCTQQGWQRRTIPKWASTVVMSAACSQDWLCCKLPKWSHQMRLMLSDCIAGESAAFKLMKLPTSAI